MTVVELFSDERNWCQHALKQKCDGRWQFCLYGALIFCYGDYLDELAAAQRKVLAVLTRRGISRPSQTYLK